MPEKDRPTDDVSGPHEAVDDDEAPAADAPEPEPDPSTTADPPPAVAELAAACVRFVAARYGLAADFTPETLSLVDQWLRDARAELPSRPELADLVQSAAGAYLGEVIRRSFGAHWTLEGDHADWRLRLATVYCGFNPLGMAREALLLEPADGWHAHFELDPGERELVERRLDALPEVEEDEYYLPSTRFDVVQLVVETLREHMRAQGLSDVRFDVGDYDE